MSERPQKFVRAMYYLQQSGYDDVREYVEELEEQYGEDLRAADEESDDEVDEPETDEPEAEEDVDPEPPEDATEESEEDTTEESDEETSFAGGLAEAVDGGDMTVFTVGELEDGMDEVEDGDLLVDAYEMDGRTTAQDAYAARYQELTGDELGGDD